MEKTVKKKVKITKYTSRAELVENLAQWHSLFDKSAESESYIEQFKSIYARLLCAGSERLALADFVQKYKLSMAETFILLRVSMLRFHRQNMLGHYKISTLLEASKPFGTRKELIGFLLEGQSVLFKQGILGVSEGSIDLKRNLLLTATKKKAKTKKRILNPQHVLAQLNKYVIGQEEAKKQVVAGVFEHLSKCMNGDKQFNKSNIFISGPSGTGKTYLCQCLAKILKIPFLHVDATKYTQTGYAGQDVGSILQPLYPYIKEKNKLPISIVFIDEIDKLREGSEKYGSSSINVQAELLRMIEADSYNLEKRGLVKITAECDISQVLFIVGGAFHGLQIKYADKSIGFTKEPVVSNRTLTADDYIGYGMMPELGGRFSYFVQLKELEKDDLRRILLNPHNGPLHQYEALVKTFAPKVSSEVVERIVDTAYERHLGARGLHQQVGQLFQAQFLEHPIQIEI